MSLNRYVTVVSLLGLTVLATALATSSPAELVPSSWELWFFTLALVVGECIPMRLVHHGSEGEITTSSTFALALLLTAGVPATMVAMTAAAVVADARQRKSISRTAFNVGQYAIVVAAAGLTLRAVSGFDAATQEFAPSDLVAACAAAGVFFVVNAVLVARAVSLVEGAAFWRYLRTDLELQTSTVGILLGLGPIVVIAADFSLAALPLLGLPLIALLRSGRKAVDHQREALHDSLTGLPNRMLLGDRIEQALVLSRRTGSVTAVMLMDLDRFKDINDTLGHHQGDRVLQAVADRLRVSVRESDTVARLGGDEFAIVLPGSTPEIARAVAQKVCAAIEEPFITDDGLELRVRGSIGVALAPHDGDDTETLVRRADSAMYRAKAAGGGETLYAPEIDDAPPERLLMVAELRAALDRRELVMHFQPKISLQTGRIEGLEALVRWPHPRLGLLYPDRFLELSERAGLMPLLTSFAIDAALQECRSWLAAGLEVKVAVNLSPESLRDDCIVDEVEELLAVRKVPGRLLQLEITENCLVADPETAGRVLARLRELEVGIAIDDFGTGYSSLAHIKDLPIDEIKIDRSFVSGLEEDTTEAAIVRSTIQLAHDLGLRVVAEGVETSDVLGRLAGFGCDAVQGFLLGRPVPGEDLWPALTGEPTPGVVPLAA